MSPVPFVCSAFGDLLVKLIESCTKQISLAGQAIFKLFYRASLTRFLAQFKTWVVLYKQDSPNPPPLFLTRISDRHPSRRCTISRTF